MNNPSPITIERSRKKLGMGHAQAAAVLHCSYRAWQQWETGRRKMHPALWELWKIKTSR